MSTLASMPTYPHTRTDSSRPGTARTTRTRTKCVSHHGHVELGLEELLCALGAQELEHLRRKSNAVTRCSHRSTTHT
jgi:hypothetical protein